MSADVTDAVLLAGDIWPFDDPRRVGATPIGADDVVGICIAAGRKVLQESGLHTGPLDHDAVTRLHEQLTPGSREDVALSLWIEARNAQAYLSQTRRGPAEPWIEAIAGVFFVLGQLYPMLASLQPKGIADRARSGRKLAAGGAKGAAALHTSYVSGTDTYGKIRARILASRSKYKSDTACAKAEHKALGIGESTARRWLKEASKGD